MREYRQVMVLGAALLGAVQAWAGNLDSPGAPTAPASAMYTIEAVYNRLDTGAAGSMQVFTDPAAGPTAGTMHTLNEVMAKAPLLDAANGATAAQVLSGKTYWGLLSGGWGPRTGTMANNGAVTITPTATALTIPAGYHNGSGSVDGDADLVSGNIKSGINIFGVNGDPNVVNTSSGDATAANLAGGKKAWVDGVEVTGTAKPAPVAKSGQTTLNATGDDGDLERGEAWPNPRFTNNSNGTVTDNLTGLIWLKRADYPSHNQSWSQALSACATLQHGVGGLTDGSVAGDWRLPNVRELQSLIHFGYMFPALPNTAGTARHTDGTPFTTVASVKYWSSTTCANDANAAFNVDAWQGAVGWNGKNSGFAVWPVRGP